MKNNTAGNYQNQEVERSRQTTDCTDVSGGKKSGW